MKMSLTGPIATIVCSLFTVNLAFAEAAYVTDQLRLSIHEAPDTSDSAFASILSGEKIDVLEENIYYARVKMEDGRIGWVRKTYLVKDPPAIRRVKDLEAERDKLAATTKRLQNEVIDTKTRLKELDGSLSSASNEIRSDTEQLRDLQKQNNALAQKLDAYRLSLPSIWAGGIALCTLLLGMWLGWWLTDYRLRKRHGGFRL